MSHNASFYQDDSNAFADTRSYHSAVTDAEEGSIALHEAMRRQFLAFAAKHGVTVRDATLLLMNGVGL